MMKKLLVPALTALALALVVPAHTVAQQDEFDIGDRLDAGAGEANGFREIDWDDLIPPGWMDDQEAELDAMLDEVLGEGEQLEQVDDFDPRAMEVMERIRELWDNAPVVERLDGERVRIPGFVVPLEGDGNKIYEFLLVPYFGACIHVPPPPANQLVHVMPDEPIPADWNMVPVWVNGQMTVQTYDSEMGVAGYQMRGIEVEEYL
jgi:uncharacterized protein